MNRWDCNINYNNNLSRSIFMKIVDAGKSLHRRKDLK